MDVSRATGRRLLARLASAQRSGRLPSVVAGVLREGGVVWRAGYGEQVGTAVADSFDVQYRIGSITKTFTAVLVHQLVREGRIDLDDRVGEFLGEVGYADRTLRSLLAHDSGLPAEPVGPWWEAAPGVDWDELVAANPGELVFPAHQQFHYSNLAFALLGEVTARVVGQPWWQLVEERILTPLGMTRTTYLPDAPAARGYAVHPYEGTLAEQPATDTGAMAPAGQAWSTLTDLARWAAFLLAGHPQVLPLTELLAASHPVTGDRHDQFTSARGLGFMLVAGGSGVLVGHSGSMPGFLAGCFVDRGRGTGAVILANGTSGLRSGELARDLLELLEECEATVMPPWRPAATVPAELADLLGVWHWGRAPMVFTHEEGALVVRVNGVVEHEFEVVGGRVIGRRGYHAGEELREVRAADNSVDHLEVSTFVFSREPR